MQLLRFCLLIPLLLLSLSVKPSNGLTERCQQAHHSILCLRFDEARPFIEEEKKLNPRNTQPYLLDNYIDFLKVMIGEQEEDYTRLKQQRNFRLEKTAYGDATSPWYRYSQALIYLQCGFARVKFRDYLTAGVELNQAYRLLVENMKRFPAFVPNKTCLGMLHALIGTVPDNYRWAVRTLKFSGTIHQGIGELETACQQSAKSKEYGFNYPESEFLLAFASINLSGKKSAAEEFITRCEQAPLNHWVHQSPLMAYALANIYLKTGNNDKAINVLKSRPQEAGYYPFFYLDYLLGIAKLNRLDKDANIPLLGFVAGFRGLNYIKSAYEHIAWYYLINGNMEKYRLYLNRIAMRGNNQVDNDREAIRNAALNQVPNVFLLKSRLLFDGGYYERAIETLAQFEAAASNMSQSEILEFTYRKGRIYDEWGKQEQAIINYQSALNLGNKLPFYYAANAALHLGLIYERMNDYRQAKTYFEKCLSLDFEEYHFSITHKARAGLNRLSGK